MKHRKVLITGGGGMIGSHLIDVITNETPDCQIIILDNFSVGSESNIPVSPHIKVINGSVLDKLLMDKLISQVEIVYHLATLKKGSDNDPSLDTMDTIVGSARIILDVCAHYNVRLILASTSDVYGYGTQLPFKEDHPISIGPFNSRRWAYAVAKLYTEQLANDYIRSGLDVRIIRYFGGFSERSSFTWRGGHIPKFCYNAYHGIDLEIHGDGLQTRCVTHGSDLAKGTLLVGKLDNLNGELFNIGSAEEITVLDAAKEVLKRFPNSGSKIVHIQTNNIFGTYKDIARRRPDLSKAKEMLGYSPELSFSDGIDIMVNHLRRSK